MGTLILSITSVLDGAIKKSLGDSVDNWFAILLIFTAVVAIGVLLEGVELLPKRLKDRAPGIIRFLEVGGWLLVALGVGGELVAEGYVTEYEGLLREFNDTISIAAEKEIADVRLAAEVATETAKGFEVQIASANALASANAKEAARLNLLAEHEQLERVRLAETISWRTPDRASIPARAISLQPFTGQRYAFVSDFSDPERTNVVGWITVLLATAKWKVESAPVSPQSELTFQATNVVLWLSPNAPQKVLDSARSLEAVLDGAKLAAVVLQSGWGPQPDSAPADLIRIVIFKKGPRMTVTGNMVIFEGSPTRLFFGTGPPR